MPIEGACGILVNLTGGPDLKLNEVKEVVNYLHQKADPDCNIIMGAVVQDGIAEDLVVTLIATGFPEAQNEEKSLPSLIKGTARKFQHYSFSEKENKKMVSKQQNQKIFSIPKNRLSRSRKIERYDELPPHDHHDLITDDLDIPTFLRRNLDR